MAIFGERANRSIRAGWHQQGSLIRLYICIPGLATRCCLPAAVDAVDSPIPLSCRSAAVNGDCLAPCALALPSKGS
jgi:hypothetical protein